MVNFPDQHRRVTNARRKALHDIIVREFEAWCKDPRELGPVSRQDIAGTQRHRKRLNAVTKYLRGFYYDQPCPLPSNYVLPTDIIQVRKFLEISRYAWWHSLRYATRHSGTVPITPNYSVMVVPKNFDGWRFDWFILQTMGVGHCTLIGVISQWYEEPYQGQCEYAAVLEGNPKWHQLIERVRHFESPRCECYKYDKSSARAEADESASTDRLIIGYLGDAHFPTNPSTCRYLLRRVIGDTPKEAPPPSRGALVQTFAYTYGTYEESSANHPDDSIHTIQLLVSEGQWSAGIQRDAVRVMTTHRKWLTKISKLKTPGYAYSNSGRSKGQSRKDNFLDRFEKSE